MEAKERPTMEAKETYYGGRSALVSLSPNNIADRHKFWLGYVNMSGKIGTDNGPDALSNTLLTHDGAFCSIQPTTPSSGVAWLK